MTEMTALGRCPTCNQPRWQAAVCTCTHKSTPRRRPTVVDTYRDALDEIEALRTELDEARADLSGDGHSAQRCGEPGPRCPGCVIDELRAALRLAQADIKRLLEPTGMGVRVIGSYTITGLDPSGVQVDGGQT